MPRPRKPTALKILDGDHKINPSRILRNEPMPKGEVVPPAHLSKAAREIWDEIAPSMIDSRMLTPPDVPLMAELCEALCVARLGRIRAVQEATGRLEVKPGAPSPTATWSRAMHIVIQLASRFGMTPADRARLDLGEPSSQRADGADLLTPHSWSR